MLSPNTYSTFGSLIRKLLKSMDQFNSTDLTLAGPNSPDVDNSGTRAGLCLNLALHQIYDLIKDSKYLEAYPSTKLSSKTDVEFIDLDEEAFLDEIEAITEATNNYRLIRRSWGWYRDHYTDPSEAGGTPQWYIRRGNRVYLAPRPNAIINYTIDFKKFTGDLEVNADLPLIPTHYDYWIISEAKEYFRKMENDDYVMVVPEQRSIAMDSIFSGYDTEMQAGSAINRNEQRGTPFDRL